MSVLKGVTPIMVSVPGVGLVPLSLEEAKSLMGRLATAIDEHQEDSLRNDDVALRPRPVEDSLADLHTAARLNTAPGFSALFMPRADMEAHARARVTVETLERALSEGKPYIEVNGRSVNVQDAIDRLRLVHQLRTTPRPAGEGPGMRERQLGHHLATFCRDTGLGHEPETYRAFGIRAGLLAAVGLGAFLAGMRGVTGPGPVAALQACLHGQPPGEDMGSSDAEDSAPAPTGFKG